MCISTLVILICLNSAIEDSRHNGLTNSRNCVLGRHCTIPRSYWGPCKGWYFWIFAGQFKTTWTIDFNTLHSKVVPQLLPVSPLKSLKALSLILYCSLSFLIAISVIPSLSSMIGYADDVTYTVKIKDDEDVIEANKDIKASH